MSSNTVWGTLAIVAFAVGAGAACTSGVVTPGGVLGSDPNSSIPNNNGVPNSNDGVPKDNDGTVGQGGTTGSSSGRQLLNLLLPCEGAPASCSDAELDTFAGCVTSTCNSQLRACFGDGSSGGACSEVFGCYRSCACGDNACQNACKKAISKDAVKACSSCLDTFSSCAKTCSAPACMADGDIQGEPDSSNTGGQDAGTTTTTPSGKTCADLAACCQTLDESKKSQCDAALASEPGNEACGQYAAYFCP